MPPIDASIPLGAKVPDSMKSLSSLVGVANGAQALQQNQQKTQQGGIDLQERQGLQQFMSNPANYSDKDGNVDFNAAMQGVMKVAPTTGLPVVQNLLTAQKQHVEATSALSKLDDDNRTRVANVLATIPPDAPSDLVVKSFDALGKAYGGKIDPWIKLAQQGYEQAQKNGPDAVASYLLRASRAVLPQQTQQEMNTPSGVAIGNGQTTGLLNLKPGVQGVTQGGLVPGSQVQQLVPVGQQNSVITDGQGNLHTLHKDAFGNVIGTTPLQGAPAAPGAAPAPGPFQLPQGETKESMGELQAQRTAAQQLANSAPVIHDINRTIVAEASKGLSTGKLGELTQKVASATGYKLSGDEATDYNLLGKMLERSALTAAQSMGPHTNAGLESSIRANGSLEYTPTAIKKIAYLNDAITSGAELYRNGLETAIASSPNHIFAKREFDKEWSKVATPQVLRLKNAVDNKNPEEIASITKEVGGKGSDGAKKLHEQLTRLLQLSGQ